MYSKAKGEIAKAVDMGEFVISNEVAKELELLLQKLASAGTGATMYEEYLEEASCAIIACLPLIKKLAGEDLKSPSPPALWWNWLCAKIKNSVTGRI